MAAVRIALVTARAARGTDYDMPPLLGALQRAGAEAHEVDWDDDGADWASFDLALVRSTWDYFERLPEFLAWAARVAAQTRLLNPRDVLRWNTDKHYLADLAHAGVPVVPSTFVEPGEDAGRAVDAFFVAGTQASAHPPSAPAPASRERESRDVVVKPAVGAGSRDAQRHTYGNRDAICAHARRLLAAGRSVLLQPYLGRVDEHGETALLYFDGEFSHAIRKGPLLHRDQGPTKGLYAEESIGPRMPTPDELGVARRALAAIPFNQPLLYARVDLIGADDGAPHLLELELVEPSVFVEYAEGAADRFATAIVQRVR